MHAQSRGIAGAERAALDHVLTTTGLVRKRLDLARRFDPKLIVDFGSDVSVTLIEAANLSPFLVLQAHDRQHGDGAALGPVSRCDG